jgi:hypothetical protein
MKQGISKTLCVIGQTKWLKEKQAGVLNKLVPYLLAFGSLSSKHDVQSSVNLSVNICIYELGVYCFFTYFLLDSTKASAGIAYLLLVCLSRVFLHLYRASAHWKSLIQMKALRNGQLSLTHDNVVDAIVDLQSQLSLFEIRFAYIPECVLGCGLTMIITFLKYYHPHCFHPDLLLYLAYLVFGVGGYLFL